MEYSAKLRLRRAIEVLELTNKLFPRCASLKYYPLVVAKSRGCRIVDSDGNEYIDFVSGAAVFNIGHLHEDIVKAIVEQLGKYMAYPLVYFYAEEPCLLARKLTEITPGSFQKKVLFGFSGSDAVDIALQVSMAYTGRDYVLAFRGSFHGSTYLSMSASGIFGETVRSTFKLSKNVLFAEYANPYRNPWGINGYENPVELSNRALDTVEKAFRSTGGNIAAVILEPVQGDGGIIVPPRYFVQELAKLTREYGALLVVDEVKTGMGRTGRWWAIEHFRVEPDLLVAGKALGGGMPISAVIGRSSVLDSVPPVGLMFTLAGHALSVASALATIEIIEKEKLVERASRLGEHLYRRLVEIGNSSRIVDDVRGLGLLIGLEVVENKSSKKPSKPLALKTVWRAWENGVILLTVGTHGNVIRVAPPLNIPEEDVEKALVALENSIRDVEEDKVPDDVLNYMTGW
ncbi:MAG: aspartate aminotransferase family protein [Desulfurococcaceae archaeon]